MSSASARRRQAGFTLVELLVALVISGIFAGIVFQLIQGQGQFVALQTARGEVQQNSRGALDIMSGEIRTLAPTALLEATATSLTFMLPRAWGIACGTGAGTVTVLFPSLPTELFAAPSGSASGVGGTTVGALGIMVNQGTETTPVWAPPTPSLALPASRASVTAVAPVAATACNALGWQAPTGAAPVAYTFTASNLPAIAQGNAVYFYQMVKYDVAADADPTKRYFWLRRSQGLRGTATIGVPFNQQPLAGPLPAANSLALTYYNSAGVLVGAPAQNRANLNAVARIGVRLTTRNRGKTGAELQTETAETTIHLRNARP